MSDSPGIRDVLDRLAGGGRLDAAGAEQAMGQVLCGEATGAQLAALLTALRVRGETEDEILGFARALRAQAIAPRTPPGPLLDTCGTGGDGRHTHNVSTAAALVAAAHSARVVKHGNRAVGSRSGSADVLQALGVRVELAPHEVGSWIEDAGFAFLFAPAFHPAMRHTATVRRELGFRTAMNLLGPLVNPASASHQLVGLFSRDWLAPAARILSSLGVARALVVHSDDGMDEISPSAPTRGVLVDGGNLREVEIDPLALGVPPHGPGAIRGGDARENAAAIEGVLRGDPGALADAVALNAGAALWVWGSARDLGEGMAEARETLRSGRAAALLARLRELSGARPGGLP